MIDAPYGYLHRWNTWRRVSVNREILSATLAVGGMTAAVHVVTAARDIIIAYQFGTTDTLDAFLIAVLLPYAAVSIVAGSFASAFIPIYISVQHREGQEAAKQLYQSLMTWTLILLAGLVTVLALTASVIVRFLGSGFSPEKLDFTRSLLLMLLPVLMLKGLATVWTAVLLPYAAVSIVAGSFASAFIPIYISVQHREGQEAAKQLYQSLMTWTLILLAGLVTVLALTASVIVRFLGSGFSPEKLDFTRSLLLMLLPVLMLKGLATVWTAVLNAGERFFVAAGIPFLTPAITIALLLVAGHQWGIYALVVGTVGGAFVETAVWVRHLRRSGIPITPRYGGWSPAIAEVLRQYGPVVAGAMLMSSTVIVDQAMAAMLGPGSVSILNFGTKIVSFLLTVGATALGTAVLPHFSRMVAQNDWLGVRHTLRTYIRLILLTAVPLTVCCVYLSEWLVQVIFERGAFTAADTLVVSRVQEFMLLQIPLYLVGILIVRLISALRANSILMWGCVMNFVVNVVLNYVLMQWLHVAGIALSTAVVYLVSVTYLSVMLRRVLKQCEFRDAIQSRPA